MKRRGDPSQEAGRATERETEAENRDRHGRGRKTERKKLKDRRKSR